jgi:ubiquinone/menaquinone biosynthesis C-methylase UbiE
MPHGHRRFEYDDPDRRKMFEPESLLARIGLGPGMTFIDIGCGEGFFAVPAAKIVGPAGRVIAVDINGEAIAHLEENAVKEGLANISAHAGEAERTIPCDGCADIVFFGTVLHDFEDPARVLRNARAALKPAGKLANLDWKKLPMEMGPRFERRLDEATASGLITRAGFRIESAGESGSYHYLIIASPDRGSD